MLMNNLKNNDQWHSAENSFDLLINTLLFEYRIGATCKNDAQLYPTAAASISLNQFHIYSKPFAPNHLCEYCVNSKR